MIIHYKVRDINELDVTVDLATLIQIELKSSANLIIKWENKHKVADFMDDDSFGK